MSPRSRVLGDSVCSMIAGLRDYDVELLIRLANEEKERRIAEGSYDPSYERLLRDNPFPAETAEALAKFRRERGTQ